MSDRYIGGKITYCSAWFFFSVAASLMYDLSYDDRQINQNQQQYVCFASLRIQHPLSLLLKSIPLLLITAALALRFPHLPHAFSVYTLLEAHGDIHTNY